MKETKKGRTKEGRKEEGREQGIPCPRCLVILSKLNSLATFTDRYVLLHFTDEGTEAQNGK